MGTNSDELRGRETGCMSGTHGTLGLRAYGLSPIVRVMRASQGGGLVIRVGGARTHASEEEVSPLLVEPLGFLTRSDAEYQSVNDFHVRSMFIAPRGKSV